MIAPQLKNFEGLVSTKVEDVSEITNLFILLFWVYIYTLSLYVLQDEGSNLEAFAARSFDPSFSWKVLFD